MVTTQNLIQAYRQAPWRNQIQWIALFLLCLVSIALIIGFYLNISAEATAAGYDIEQMLDQKGSVELSIADLRNDLAQKTTAVEMEKRAQKLGFVPVDPSKIRYIAVPGYVERQTPNLASNPKKDVIAQPLIKPAYTQSLWEWLYEGALQLGQYAGSVK